MLLYEMFPIGIAVVLVVAAIGGLAALVMMGPEETALSRLARAAPAQRRLVASAAQQERDARAATAQRRLVAAAARPDAADHLTPIFFRQQTGVIKANQAVDNMFRYGPRV